MFYRGTALFTQQKRASPGDGLITQSARAVPPAGALLCCVWGKELAVAAAFLNSQDQTPRATGQLVKLNFLNYRHLARASRIPKTPHVQLRINGENKVTNYIQTLSGKKFDYINATVNDIEIEDIGTALSNICRFSGHLPEFYSVAQHSVLCSQIVPAEFAFEALMHDAPEAYCQDIPTPLKVLLPDYRRIESRVDGLIRTKFDIPQLPSPVVKYADRVMLATERRDLELDDSEPWGILEGIIASDLIQIVPLRPGQAFGLFMNRFNELMELRQCAA